MNSKPYFQIRPDGAVSVLSGPPSTAKIDYSKNPVQFAIRSYPLRLELHGENFSTVANLTTDDALSIILMLTYAVRESVYTPPKCEVIEVAR